jgi:membrane protein YqaA with SNARE-associated domain
MEIYQKRQAYNVRVLGRYENKTMKCVWYERYRKQCLLASGMPNRGCEKLFCKTSLTVSTDEILALYESVSKAKKVV